jgi:hypothetical protein
MIKLNDELRAIRNQSLRNLKDVIESYDDIHLDYLSNEEISKRIDTTLDEINKLSIKDEWSFDECVAFAYGLGLKLEFVVVPYSKNLKNIV